MILWSLVLMHYQRVTDVRTDMLAVAMSHSSSWLSAKKTVLSPDTLLGVHPMDSPPPFLKLQSTCGTLFLLLWCHRRSLLFTACRRRRSWIHSANTEQSDHKPTSCGNCIRRSAHGFCKISRVCRQRVTFCDNRACTFHNFINGRYCKALLS